MTFLLQATDLIEVNPKTKQKVAVDPGSTAVTTIKPTIKGLKPSHPAKADRSFAATVA